MQTQSSNQGQAKMDKSVAADLIATVLSSSVVVAECATPVQQVLRECSDAWRAKAPENIPPGPDDAHDPRNRQLLSQTPGAKSTRALKLQAFKDATTLECIRQQADLHR